LVSIDDHLLDEARRLEIDVEHAAETGIAQAIAERKADRWLQENRAALDSSNAWVEQHGLPLAAHRRF
jgi:antitoxin CcdA